MSPERSGNISNCFSKRSSGFVYSSNRRITANADDGQSATMDLVELIESNWIYSSPILFVGIWVFVSYLISVIGGWGALAKHYPAESTFSGEMFRRGSGRLGMGNYGGCLTLGTNVKGLYLAVAFIFRVGHPPLFVPWQDITAKPQPGRFFPRVELEFAKSPGNRLRISRGLADKISKASAGRLRF